MHGWAEKSPRSAYHLLPGLAQETALEKSAFDLFRDLSLAFFAVALDVVLLCQRSDPRCADPSYCFQQVPALRSALEAKMTELVRHYAPDSGVRSPIIRTGRILRSALDGFVRRLPRLADGLRAAEDSLELVRWMGQQGRTLAHQLGLHAWVRTLAVPGRGAPVFILHDDYGAWPEMLRAIVANMVRNGQRPLALAEVGPAAGAEAEALLAEFEALQYVGILAGAPAGALQRLGGRLQTYGPRAVLRESSSIAAAAAFPHRTLDIALVDAGGDPARVAQDLEWWEARVKPGGILGGRGLEPGAGGVGAVCSRRFGNDIHLGVGGTFWWYVEPEEEGG